MMYLGYICKVLAVTKMATAIWFNLVFINWNRFALIKQKYIFSLGMYLESSMYFSKIVVT